MAQSLVIVESPAKAKTIGKFLDKNFKVKASMGHVRDLPKSQIGVDVENNYNPKYITIRGKGKLIDELKKEAKKSDKILLATDPDREGEAISWHLAAILGLDSMNKCRIEFHEITKKAVLEAINKPRTINKNLVDAQQARRILDRLVGYEISPILWKKVKWGLSAGRVQSVAVRLICDREKEIKDFIPKEYWSLTAKFKEGNKVFEAKFYGNENEKISIDSKEQAEKIISEIENGEYIVKEVKKLERKKNPLPPFTTSTLQQEAYKKLNFTTKKTMSVAQQLYEGIDLKNEGTVGLITYMRTDSVRISSQAQEDAFKYINKKYGNSYTPSTKRTFKTKANAQDAHEAIRPTMIDRDPDSIKDSLSIDQYKLYKLIWSRFIASQMAEAVYDTTTVDIKANNYLFKASGSTLRFSGFLTVYDFDDDEDEKNKIPELKIGQVLNLKSLDPAQHFTQPPARFTEATLVKALEENGIGRPSTYAPIISTILDRGYVIKEKKSLYPTDLGIVVTELLKEYFKDIVDIEFTAQMENKLDEIEDGKEYWVKIVDNFYTPLKKQIDSAEEKINRIEVEEPVEVTDIKCDKCGKYMVIKKGKFGKFLACPGYPECKNTKPLLEEIEAPCPKCGAKVVIRKTKKGKIFYGCSRYPECNFVSWNKPTKEKCPECGNILFEKNYKGHKQLICSNEECKYKKSER
ncbi:DNA topoisomerase I [Caloramator quimbayensis]|uniref:DNA topoisomerase 1 n=1 Tax=Caloramator quimbayensis TaxID=1147123 RepID=A0A1T4XRE2_9CLOT|nr:type I DNA topoisomerase [Caloramator quimbayensis]SKA92119.1 DNA topoisomerase I [Caloramator quimbayensis]